MDFSYLFSVGKSGVLGPRCVDRVARLESIVDQGSADKRARHASARVGRCSPATVEEDEPVEVVLEGSSLEHERW
jgi:hypothetical protein